MQRPDVPDEATHREYFGNLVIPRINNSPMTRIEGLNIKLQFEITGRDAGKWTLVVEDGKAKEVVEGDAIIPDCTLGLSGDVFMGIVRQEINPLNAFFEGKIKVSGDTTAAIRIAALAPYL